VRDMTVGQIQFCSAFSAASVSSEVNGTASRHEHLRFPPTPARQMRQLWRKSLVWR